MNSRLRHLLLVSGLIALIFGCSNKNSGEACLHQATMDLDSGNYDSVLMSSCADSMMKGAAYLGKAGFSASKVINALIDANNAVSPQTPLSVYMTELVDQANDGTLADLDAALANYSSIHRTSDSYYDAQFDISLVSTIKGLSLLRLFITAESPGALTTACDVNQNNYADSIDAASCALFASSGQSCGTGYIVTVVPDLILSGITGTFQGSIVQITGSGSTASCPANNEYKRSLSLSTGVPDILATTSQLCHEASPDNTRSWPCPLVSATTPTGLAAAFDHSLNRAISSLNTALTATSSDVGNAIIDLKKQNCCTPPEVWNSTTNDPSSCTCNALDLGTYLLTL